MGSGAAGAARTLVFAIVLSSLPDLHAADSRATLPVSATVMPVARLEISGQDPWLLVADADVVRGYIDATRPLELRVRGNSRAGFALDVAPLAPLFDRVTFAGFDVPVALGADGGTIVQRWQEGGARAITLHVRFGLPATLAPGRYAWPLHLAVRPL